jgi:hypothetical protein
MVRNGERTRASQVLPSYAPVAALILLAFALSLRTVQTPDLWWHMASGRWMVENREILDRDVFTFSSPDIPWTNRMWLGSVVFYLMYAAGGLSAVSIVTAIMVTAVFAAVALKRGGARHPVAFLLLGLSVLAVAHLRFLHRPALLTDLLAPATILLWLQWRDARSGWLAPLLLALVQVVWTHLHEGFVLGLVIAAAFLADAICRTVSMRAQLSSKADKRSMTASEQPTEKLPLWVVPTIVLAVGVIAILVTPWRKPLFESFLRAPSVLGQTVVEWVPTFSTMGRRVLGPFFWVFAVFVGFSILIAVRYWWKRNSHRRPKGEAPSGRIAETIILAALVLLSVFGLRFIATLALAGFPLVWEFSKDELGTRDQSRQSRRKNVKAPRPSMVPALTLTVATLLLVISVVTNGYYRYWRAPTRFGVGVMKNLFPEKLVDWVETNRIEGRFFNGYDMGGYLDWRFGPEHQVFTDSRVVSEAVYSDYLEVCRSTAAWPDLVSRYKLNGAILDKRDGDGMARLYSFLKADPAWTVAYEDARFALVVQNQPGPGF